SLCGFGRRDEAGGSSYNVGCRGTGTISFAHVSPAMAAAGQAGRRSAGRFDGHDESNPSRRTAREGFVVGRTVALLRGLVDGERERGKRKQRSGGSVGPRRMGCSARRWKRRQCDPLLYLPRSRKRTVVCGCQL